VTINAVLPGPFLTDRLRSGIEYEARRQNISFEEHLAKRGASTPAGRVGDPAEFGDACAFLCGPRRALSSARICCSTAARSIRRWDDRARRRSISGW
jgi:NAD(P)-dependent dehydrogenase (short-subunit alcohol dehydrogenase family)